MLQETASAWFDDRGRLGNYNPNDNSTVPFLTVYEKTHILGTRMTQLANGAKSFLKRDELKARSIKEIAHMEFDQRKLPFILIRTMPNGKKEYWRLSDLYY